MTHTVTIPASGLKVGHRLSQGIVTKIRTGSVSKVVYITVTGDDGQDVKLPWKRPTDNVTVIKGQA